MVHPKHMNVDYLRNVNDIGITSNVSYAQLNDETTEITFSRFRCRGSKSFREVVDAAWKFGSEREELMYEAVLSFDKKFRDILLDFNASSIRPKSPGT